MLSDKREKDKRTLEEKMLQNVRTLIMPLLANLKDSGLNDHQMSCLKTAEAFLNEILSLLTNTLHAQYLRLPPSEIRVAHLVRQGKPTKESQNCSIQP